MEASSPSSLPSLGACGPEVAGGHRRRDPVEQLLGDLVAAQLAVGRGWSFAVSERRAPRRAPAHSGIGRGAGVDGTARRPAPAARGSGRCGPRPPVRWRRRAPRRPGASRRPSAPPPRPRGRSAATGTSPGAPGRAGRSQTAAATASAPGGDRRLHRHRAPSHRRLPPPGEPQARVPSTASGSDEDRGVEPGHVLAAGVLERGSRSRPPELRAPPLPAASARCPGRTPGSRR